MFVRQELPEAGQVDKAIAIADEAVAPIDAALNDMKRDVGNTACVDDAAK
jgi:hypothetical protein